MKDLVSIGVIVVFIGFLIIFIGALSQSKTDTKVAVGGFIGFIPFGFANDRRMMYFVIGLMAVFLVFWVWMNWFR